MSPLAITLMAFLLVSFIFHIRVIQSNTRITKCKIMGCKSELEHLTYETGYSRWKCPKHDKKRGAR